MVDPHLLQEDDKVTVDSLYDGRLVCLQPKKGYRYSVDSLLLAHFSSVDIDDEFLDLGCGCGIVGLILLFRQKTLVKKVVGLELQTELVGLAKKNIHLNAFEDTFSVVEGDLREIHTLFAAETFSKVVCNPPFFKNISGRKSSNRQSLVARHQVCSTTDQVMSAASFSVKNKGYVSVVFPAEGLVEIVDSMVRMRLRPKRMQAVYSYPDSKIPAKLILIEAIKNGGPGTKLLPPLYIYKRKNGEYSEQMQEMYNLHANA